MLSHKIITETLDELQDYLCEVLGVDKLEIITKDIKEDAIIDLDDKCIVLLEKASKDMPIIFI